MGIDKRQKTDITLQIPILLVAYGIIDRYKNNPKALNKLAALIHKASEYTQVIVSTQNYKPDHPKFLGLDKKLC